ncbi:hypothetical protein L210DRAFT_3648102 [Boletus edulis BED1]|uniref:DNA-directed DNA polymerase family B exonuclease domain-containing protein n=1 Tax=Boletus edulis BED1 TaxID=1328754 RepID=A0AAD4BPS4_BOLED|nr:hypothetical protein L210DRAFT_3648102 [Boletus edulis BED1]
MVESEARWQEWVMTTFECVETLWEPEWRTHHGLEIWSFYLPAWLDLRTDASEHLWMAVLATKRSELHTREGQHMTLFSMEVFAPSRGDRIPDANRMKLLLDQGILVVHSPQLNPHRLHDYSLEVFSDELDLINRIIDIIVNVDPDILVGWEVQATPWGYISFRGSQYGLDVAELMARAPTTLARSGTD